MNTQQKSADCVHPCPCGNYGSKTLNCTCTPNMIKRYQAKLSGPLLDRIDIHVDVPQVEYDKLMDDSAAESTASIRNRVERARKIQQNRFSDLLHIFANGDMNVSEIQEFCHLSSEARQLLELSVRKMRLSARSYHRVLKLSRTIADLDESDRIEVPHVAEALQYRPQSE